MDIIDKIQADLEANKRVYLKKGTLPPKGKVVKRGPRNGLYYEDADISPNVANILNKHEGSPQYIMEEVYKTKTLLDRLTPVKKKMESDLKNSQKSGDTKATAEIQKKLEIFSQNVENLRINHDDGLTAYGIAKKNRESK